LVLLQANIGDRVTARQQICCWAGVLACATKMLSWPDSDLHLDPRRPTKLVLVLQLVFRVIDYCLDRQRQVADDPDLARLFSQLVTQDKGIKRPCLRLNRFFARDPDSHSRRADKYDNLPRDYDKVLGTFSVLHVTDSKN